jgi:protein tyrosine/serine phosphatase
MRLQRRFALRFESISRTERLFACTVPVIDTLFDVTPDRTVPFTGVFNFRDLGGYASSDGRVTRWGRLYRSDALHDLSQSDLTLFRRLGIATIVDLRNTSEVERTGRGLLEDESIRFINTPVLSSAGVPEPSTTSQVGDDYLSSRYLQYLDGGANALLSAIEEMTDVDNYPLVFNCFFGKDRTGVLSALVLSILGVSRRDIVNDYALTATRVPLILEKLRLDPVYLETLEQTDPRVLAAEASTISLFLHELDERHGGARDWAHKAGLPAYQLDALADLLLE